MKEALKLGTRGSPLAVAQSTQIARALEAAHPGLKVELVRITTTGDQMQAGPVKPVESTKAIFTKELEEAMLAGQVDFAVHSAKDLAAAMPEGLVLAAVPVRASCADVLISRRGLGVLGGQERMTLASSSLRRSLQWVERYPGASFVPLRGNIDTRIMRLREHASWDGIILARAGLTRLPVDLSGLVAEDLPTEWMLPAPGQGALALQARADDADTLGLLVALDDPATRRRVGLERAFLVAMEAGCHVPLGALADEPEDGGRFRLRAVFYHEGQPQGRKGEVSGRWDEAEQGVRALAAQLRGP
ncbi:MAG: hydroxymethylbilane synthase [Candidatus Methylacidiphilales bacterium]|nr:hydroxymethylbilane synthase [Candidatus Methylacidiphilales bacterium]